MAAKVVEVIQINCPHGCTCEPVLDNEARLLSDGVNVIEPDPLTVAGGVGTARISAGRFDQLVAGYLENQFELGWFLNLKKCNIRYQVTSYLVIRFKNGRIECSRTS